MFLKNILKKNYNNNFWNKNDQKWKKRNNYEKEPPNLDEIFINFFRKINKVFNLKPIKKSVSNKFLILLIIICITVWFFSGFYTIKEAERGLILRLGKFNHIVYPGLNWKPTFIDKLITINVESVKELVASGVMLTADENVVRVEMNVQYKITNPKLYLFSVVNADDSLKQATDSALREIIGKYDMDRILTEGRTLIRNDTYKTIENTIKPYNMGITVLDVNFQTARPPEEVKEAFDDAIAARENEQQYIREAEAYANEVQPHAYGQAQRILEEGRSYSIKKILTAQGEVLKFNKLLSEYKIFPDITKKRLYLDTLEKIFENTKKVLVSSTNCSNILLSLNKNFDIGHNINYNNSYVNSKTNKK
ncbi:MAG: FtsH protease activity modulator HflK [Candidatus Lightella neohaematopini]|nr:FtsH protease activity modulator HflK [Candidatus Lightella neohaematopini]